MLNVIIRISGIRIKASELICNSNPEVFLCLFEKITENLLMLMQGRLADTVNAKGRGLLRTSR